MAKTIKSLKSTNPKEYWNILNRRTDSNVLKHILLDILHEHFAKLDAATHDGNHGNNIDQSRVTTAPDPILDNDITHDEINKAKHSYKCNKSCDLDQIINEYMKNSLTEYIELYVKLVNLVLKSDIMPEDWCVGVIKPLYKGKSDEADPNNYRGITIVRCMGKLFTCVFLNTRLSEYLRVYKSNGPEQAGFKADYSTVDHISNLKAMINLFLFRHKRLYVCFVDFEKAFDNVNRLKLWQKLISCNITGKILPIIKNMYNKSKSCVSTNGTKSANCPCQMGVRQGGNLSPLLFSIYLSDLE